MKVKVYSNGVVHCSVCVEKELKKKEVEKLVNEINPTGLDDIKWKISKEKFRTGESNPTDCKDDPERVHYLMVC